MILFVFVYLRLLGGTFSMRSASCTLRLLAQSTTRQASSQSMKAAAGLGSGFFGRSFIRLHVSAQLRGRQAEERNFATAFLRTSVGVTGSRSSRLHPKGLNEANQKNQLRSQMHVYNTRYEGLAARTSRSHGFELLDVDLGAISCCQAAWDPESAGWGSPQVRDPPRRLVA